MSQRVVTPFINTNIPGAYPDINVLSQPSTGGTSGIVVIFGEADGGPSYQNTVLKNNVFTPAQLAQVTAKYLSGQIVDAFTALAAPSADPAIPGSANQIYIAKTNSGTQASAIVDTDYGTLSDQNYGVPGNGYFYQVTDTQVEVAPAITGGDIPSLSALNPGMSPAFNIRLDGGALTPVTLPAGTYTTGAQVAAALTGLPSGITASGAGSGASATITLTVTADAGANRKGWGKSFELVEGAAPGDLAALGLSAGLYVSSDEPSIELTINNPNNGTNETFNVDSVIGLSLGYAGTTGTVTITSAGVLSTTVTGGSGANLSINLSQFKTIATLSAYLSAQPGYTSTFDPSAQQLPPSALDVVTGIGIASTGAGLLPGRIKDAAYIFQTTIATSQALSFSTLSGGVAGLPSAMASAAFLAGGARGATSAADIVAVLAQLGGIQANIIVPLFSEDASKDILAGLTDAGSTYTIAAINAATKSHCIAYSTPAEKHNRICILSLLDTYVNDKAASQGLGEFRCSLTMQQVSQVNSLGAIVLFQPWYAAVIAAGMQAGGFYKAIVNKAANVISFTDPVGFDSGNPGDVEDALNAGLLFLSKDTAREYWVSDQTTYGFDTNFVYNSIQAVYASDILALDLANNFQLAFVGQSLADVDSSTAASFLAQLMDGYKKLKLIAASSDAPLGYKNVNIEIDGPIMTVSVEIKLATAIYFIPITINISQIQNST